MQSDGVNCFDKLFTGEWQTWGLDHLDEKQTWGLRFDHLGEWQTWGLDHLGEWQTWWLNQFGEQHTRVFYYLGEW